MDIHSEQKKPKQTKKKTYNIVSHDYNMIIKKDGLGVLLMQNPTFTPNAVIFEQ